MNKECYVYEISHNNKSYIGVSIDPKRRFNEHMIAEHSLIGRAIRKYDLKIDSMSIIFTGAVNECFDKETELRPEPNMGYNLAAGGNGGETRRGFSHNDKTKEKIRNSLLGRTRPLEVVEKMRKSLKGRVSPNKGKKLSDDHRQNLSESHMGNKLSKESINKISEALLGRKQKLLTCPHCKKSGGNVLKRYHFDNCKQKGNSNEE